MKRYLVEPFRSVETSYKTWYAVLDCQTSNYIIETNGMVAINPDKKAVKVWAKYLNDNLPYEPPLNDMPFQRLLRG